MSASTKRPRTLHAAIAPLWKTAIRLNQSGRPNAPAILTALSKLERIHRRQLAERRQLRNARVGRAPP